MSELRRHTGLSTCTCIQCDLIRCGAVDRDWEEWPWIWLSGEARVVMMLLTQQPPVGRTGPQTRWMGCLDWFRVMGLALDFDDAEGDDDEPVG
jgi:hypothetical protein